METCIIGEWRINPDAGWLEPRRRLLRRRRYPDARLMAVLRVFIERPGELLSSERILAEAWPDRVVTRDSVTTAVYDLRQLLRDNAASPTYIRTEGRRGYRLIAAVSAAATRRLQRRSLAAAAAVTGLAIVAATRFGNVDATYLPLQMDPVRNASHDERLVPLSAAIDATLRSALIRRNPGRIVETANTEQRSLHLRSALVACDLGPALVVQLLDTDGKRFVWSRTYALDHEGTAPTLVELVASDVTDALPAS